MEGTVTISIKDFDDLRHSDEMLKKLICKIERCSEITEVGTGIDAKTFQIAFKDKVEELLKEYNPGYEVDEDYIELITWDKPGLLAEGITEEEVEASILKHYDNKVMTDLMDVVKKLESAGLLEVTLKQITNNEAETIEELICVLKDELRYAAEESR